MGLQGTRGARLLYQGWAKKRLVVPGPGRLVDKDEVVLELWSYPVENERKEPRRSFEVFFLGEQVQRFLHVDNGPWAFDLATSYCFGVRQALDLEPRCTEEWKKASDEFRAQTIGHRWI